MSFLASLHVIAISKELNKDKEYDIYVYENGKISLYSPQWDLGIEWPYSEKIREIAALVDDEFMDWVDFQIEDGQEVSRQGDVYLVENQKVEAFSRLTEENFANIGLMSSKIYNEFIRSRDKENKEVRGFLAETFDSRYFVKYIADMIESAFEYVVEVDELTDLDKQIIVRTKIDGYKFLIGFIKNILHSEVEERVEYCEIFLARVFMLESQNFIRI